MSARRATSAGERARVYLGLKPPPEDWCRRPRSGSASRVFDKIVRMQYPRLGASRSEVQWGWAWALFVTIALVIGLFTSPWYLRISDAVLLLGLFLPWLIRLAPSSRSG